MEKNLFLLRDTEAFMRGELDNVTVSGAHIVLDMVTGSYVPYGCYTSPAVPLALFDALRISWNCSAPPGTAVEAQARVMVDGNWTSWCSFGRWSPFIRREGAKPLRRGPLVVSPDLLQLDSKLATQAQLRIYLYTKDDKRTPSVRLLGAGVHAVDVIPACGAAVNGRLHLPPYAAARRAPQLAACADLAASLCSLTNRWGADILPEELALAMYDWQEGHAPNWSFAAAAAGAWGFPAWVCWTDLAGLRAEVRAGYGAVVRLASSPAQTAAGLPEQHFAALRGFASPGGKPQALLNDPFAAAEDFDTEISMPLDEFLVAWDNTALFLRQRVGRPDAGCPARSAVTVRRSAEAPGVGLLYQSGTLRPLPDDFCGDDDAPTGVLAWTAADVRPHATTAHKHFYFVTPESGGIPLPPAGGPPAKHTVYAIDACGSMFVGDVTL